MKKRILINLSLIIVLLMATLLIVDPGFIFGSKTDWINQHTIFPDYFRKTFYQTGNILPNFAPHIGAGQNIFNFSYYGLLNPIILISYLFPNLEMTTYIIIANITLYILTGILLLHFLEKHTEKSYNALLSTIILMFSSSLLFHFHRHFMFVNYMPFLLLGLIGVDAYFDKDKKVLLTLSTFLMIMTSYYYSIIGIIIFIIYGIYRYIEKNKKITLKSFLTEGIKFLIPIIIAIFMAGILLLPTAYVILEGRGNKEKLFTITELLIPKINTDAILYNTYSLGLTALSLLSLIHGATKKDSKKRFLSISIIILIICPIFIYLLNGGLYIRNKVFIPFLPLIGLTLLTFLEDIFKKNVNIKKLLIISSIIIVLEQLTKNESLLYFFILDILITLIVILIYNKTTKKVLFVIPMIIIIITNWFIGQKEENYIEKKFLKESFNQETEERLSKYLEAETEVIRSANLDSTLYTVNKIISPKHYTTSVYSSTFHKDYNHFQQKVFKNPLPNRNTLILAQSNNVMFQTFMGIKYITSSKKASVGYQELERGKKATVYKNDNVLPLGYATNRIMNKKDLDILAYPQQEEALMASAVVENANTNFNFVGKSKEIDQNYLEPQNTKNLKIKIQDGKYIVDAKKDTKIKIPLTKKLQDEILFVTFKIHNQTSCKIPNQKIGINNTYNKISCKESEYQNHNNTFHYVLSENGPWNTLEIVIGKGHYILSDFRTYILDYKEIKNKVKAVDKWHVKNQKEDELEGPIYVTKDGYFVTSIPYDKGFDIWVDGKKQKYEKVNTAFLGFPIKKGHHHIKIVYHSPLLKEGMALSIIGLIGFIIMTILNYKKRSNVV